MGYSLKLIDLDASAKIGEGYAGAKFSSAYCPPEMIYFNSDTGTYGIKTFQVDNQSDKPINIDLLGYDLTPATYSIDVWAFGILLYRTCSKMTFFHSDDEDNLVTQEDFADLYQFTDEFKTSKLKYISDLQARNLISQLLNKDPTRRPAMQEVLYHPFITGKATARMVGDDPEFDVFISYRYIFCYDNYVINHIPQSGK